MFDIASAEGLKKRRKTMEEGSFILVILLLVVLRKLVFPNFTRIPHFFFKSKPSKRFPYASLVPFSNINSLNAISSNATTGVGVWGNF
jgi:hypothetical protein